MARHRAAPEAARLSLGKPWWAALGRGVWEEASPQIQLSGVSSLSLGACKPEDEKAAPPGCLSLVPGPALPATPVLLRNKPEALRGQCD